MPHLDSQTWLVASKCPRSGGMCSVWRKDLSHPLPTPQAPWGWTWLSHCLSAAAGTAIASFCTAHVPFVLSLQDHSSARLTSSPSVQDTAAWSPCNIHLTHQPGASQGLIRLRPHSVLVGTFQAVSHSLHKMKLALGPLIFC